MPLTFTSADDFKWSVRKIAVIGPGIVGMPMAALLAGARIREGSDQPAKVVVLQRNSKTSGWKVPAINAGRSVIGGVEPSLDRIVEESVREGILSASHEYEAASDADMVLVCVQTDKKGFGPDYGPMFEALEGLTLALKRKPASNIPIIVFESTLAPSSMATLMKAHFAKHGLVEGRDILLGNSPNRVMPGRLVERVAAADKLVAGLHPLTPKLIQRIYARIVTKGNLHPTNSMTAEVVKTLENAYRDVRIAFAAEIVRYCDQNDIDFYATRDAVNRSLAQTDAASADATAVPSGGVLVPTVGVGGHCLPKDGILLWWRKIESGADTSKSLILESRKMNDDSPRQTVLLAERTIGELKGRRVALLGTAYRFDSEDTRNSPTLSLAKLLLERGNEITIHDPYVKPDDQNLERFGLTPYFTNDLKKAVDTADVLVFCTGHGVYKTGLGGILDQAPKATAIIDGANLYHRGDLKGAPVKYVGIGRATKAPTAEFLRFVEQSFRAMERGTANELQSLIGFLNERYADSEFNRVSLDTVRRLAGTCVTGCQIAQTGDVGAAPRFQGFATHLAQCAAG
ncbi:MAG: nucleotide sugar dehydrogenase [Steroidobacteraceae bacterium]|nr:nucleotide sugar dehydrogenase [Pseudomonadota bacterium]